VLPYATGIPRPRARDTDFESNPNWTGAQRGHDAGSQHVGRAAAASALAPLAGLPVPALNVACEDGGTAVATEKRCVHDLVT
jgi:hypothetical protein